MRSFFITAVLFAAMLLTITANAMYVSNTSDKIKAQINNEDFEKAPEAAIATLESLWENNRILLEFSVGYKETDLISELILDLRHYVETNNTEEVNRLRARIYEAANDISRLEKLSVENLF